MEISSWKTESDCFALIPCPLDRMGYPLMPLGRDGARTPERQTDLALQDRQMRSPDQVLSKREAHIRHCRGLDAPGTSGSRAGLLLYR